MVRGSYETVMMRILSDCRAYIGLLQNVHYVTAERTLSDCRAYIK